jgi:4-hydroxybenzoate polyprenyltransferase
MALTGTRVTVALLRSTHPGPSIVVTAIAIALGMAAGLDPWRIAVLGLVILLGQFSVGLSNDAIDARRDRQAGRRDKPLAAGAASVRSAWVSAFATLGAALALSAVLSWWMLAAHALALLSAWSYNAWLKSTPASVVPFIVSFGLLPSLVTLAGADPRPAATWAWIAGAAIGVAVHLTNVLPDLEDDAKTGVRGLPHRLGRRVSAIMAAVALVGGAVAVLAGPIAASGAPTAIGWSAFGAVLAIAAVGLVLALVRPPGRGVFRLVMLAALMLCVQLAATGQSLVG